jgi:type I restriction enzyme S subunit
VSYPVYPAYRDSGFKWLGDLPECWGVRRLKNVLVCPITDGPHTTPNFFYEGVPFLSVDGIQDGELQFEGCRFVSIEDHQLFTKKVAPKRGDILLGKAASTGKIAQVKVDLEFSIWSPLALLRPDHSQITSTFLEYSLKSPSVQAQIDVLCTHNTQSNISMDDIPKLVFPVPSDREQKAIAEFLDWKTGQIDALIAKKKELMEKLKEKRLAVITQAVTKGLNPASPLRDSGIGWIGQTPEHWDVIKIKYVSTLASGHTPSRTVDEYWLDCTIPWVSLNDSKMLREKDSISETYYQISELGLANSSARLLPAGIVVFSRDATVGLCAITAVPMAVSQHFVAYICGEKLLGKYLLFALKAMNQHLQSLQTGSTIVTIGMPEVRGLICTLPPVPEQIAIVGHIDSETAKIDQMFGKVQSAIARLTEYRTALITAATTGKIDVRQVAIPATT